MHTSQTDGNDKQPGVMDVLRDDLTDIVTTVTLLHALGAYEQEGATGVDAFNREYGVFSVELAGDELTRMIEVLTGEFDSFDAGLKALGITRRDAKTFLNIYKRWNKEQNPIEKETDK